MHPGVLKDQSACTQGGGHYFERALWICLEYTQSKIPIFISLTLGLGGWLGPLGVGAVN